MATAIETLKKFDAISASYTFGDTGVKKLINELRDLVVDVLDENSEEVVADKVTTDEVAVNTGGTITIGETELDEAKLIALLALLS